MKKYNPLIPFNLDEVGDGSSVTPNAGWDSAVTELKSINSESSTTDVLNVLGTLITTLISQGILATTVTVVNAILNEDGTYLLTEAGEYLVQE